jgi:hypothetical protein
MFITRVNLWNLYFILKCMWNFYIWRIYIILMYKIFWLPGIICLCFLNEKLKSMVKIYFQYKFKSTTMGSSGLLGPTWMEFCTWSERPTIEGPSFIGILGIHYRFGHLWCGLRGGVGFSIGSEFGLNVSLANPCSCTICLRWILCHGFIPFNATSMFWLSTHAKVC